MSFWDNILDAEVQWLRHIHKCSTCRVHVSIEWLVLRENQLCKEGRELFAASTAMADAGT